MGEDASKIGGEGGGKNQVLGGSHLNTNPDQKGTSLTWEQWATTKGISVDKPQTRGPEGLQWDADYNEWANASKIGGEDGGDLFMGGTENFDEKTGTYTDGKNVDQKAESKFGQFLDEDGYDKGFS